MAKLDGFTACKGIITLSQELTRSFRRFLEGCHVKVFSGKAFALPRGTPPLVNGRQPIVFQGVLSRPNRIDDSEKQWFVFRSPIHCITRIGNKHPPLINSPPPVKMKICRRLRKWRPGSRDGNKQPPPHPCELFKMGQAGAGQLR